MQYESICISDLHLGARNCETKKLRKFLHKIKKKKLQTKQLIIVGDGFDTIKPRHLKKRHLKIVKLIKSIAKKISVVWLLGNHDYDPLYIEQITDIKALNSLIIESGQKKIYVCHGHQYDEFIHKHQTITAIADVIYGFSQFIDPSHSLAKLLKRKSKKFIKIVHKLKAGIIVEAKKEKCNVAIHGHNHHAGYMQIDGIDVWDTGCWSEKPCTYLTIKNGKIELHNF